MKIHCCACQAEIEARHTNGREIYPNRADLHSLPFWIHDACGNYVGCHHKTNNPTRPLGCIPDDRLREARKRLHAFMDPLWKLGFVSRKDLYERLSKELGVKSFHTANTKSVEQIEKAMAICKVMASEIHNKINKD